MKTFIDASPFIYLIENNPQFAAKARKFILDAATNNEELITSVITLMEFGVILQLTDLNKNKVKYDTKQCYCVNAAVTFVSSSQNL